MKFRYIGASLAASALLLTACGQKEQNEDTKQEEKSNHNQDSSNQQEQSNHNESDSHENNNDTQNESSKESSSKEKFSDLNTNSKEYLARVWLGVLESYQDGGSDFDSITIDHLDVSGQHMYNQYTVRYDEGTYVLAATPTAAGHVVYKNNGDGTVTIYPVPSHFQDRRWIEPGFSRSESQSIMNQGKVVPLYDGDDALVHQVEGWISDGTTVPESNASNIETEASESTSDEGTVTRENVIDKVEEYEGHTLDTSTYTFKEPEKRSDGGWGFSILDKQGNLVGSYIIDADGTVTKFDENGDEV